MTSPDDILTQHSASDPNSGRRFRDATLLEESRILQDTRQSLSDLHARLSAMESGLRELREDGREILAMREENRRHELKLQELEHWRRYAERPLEAADKLDHATRGARMAVLAIFSLATCILAVAGVLQLISHAWHRFFQ